MDLPAAAQAKLKEHQREGVEFLKKALVKVNALRFVRGAVIAHSMGLGKTLTVLAYILGRYVGHLRAAAPGGPLKVLILVPKSTVPHWVAEANNWLNQNTFGASVNHTEFPKIFSLEGVQESMKTHMLDTFQTSGGIIVLGYEQFLGLVRQKAKSSGMGTESPPPPQPKTIFNGGGPVILDDDETITFGKGGEMIVERKGTLASTVGRGRGAIVGGGEGGTVFQNLGIVVLDEAHRMRNPNTKSVKTLKEELKPCMERIALTGTPVQNHLSEYGTMLSLIRPEQFGDSKMFDKLYTNPITRGQCLDAEPEHQQEMQSAVAKLQNILSDVVHRRGVALLEKDLNPRSEFVVAIKLPDRARQLYTKVVQATCKDFLQNASMQTHTNALRLRHVIGRFCAHPAIAMQSTIADPSRSMFADGDVLLPSDEEEENEEEIRAPALGDGTGQIPRTVDDVSSEVAPKLAMCIEIVKGVLARMEKIVIFSLYLPTLQMMRSLFETGGKNFPAQEKVYLLTGATSLEDRRDLVHRFNNPVGGEAATASIFLCSTKAGGIGLNLVAANHCIIFDHHWNPTDDSQATFRIFRYGQDKPTYIYRLLCQHTVEDVVFQYGLRKEWMAKKVVDLSDPVRQSKVMWEEFFQTDPSRMKSIVDVLGDPRTARQDRASKVALWQRQMPVLNQVRPESIRDIINEIIPHSFLLREDADEAYQMERTRLIDAHEKEVARRMQERKDAKNFNFRKPETNLEEERAAFHSGHQPRALDAVAAAAPAPTPPAGVQLDAELDQLGQKLSRTFAESKLGPSSEDWCRLFAMGNLKELTATWYKRGVMAICKEKFQRQLNLLVSPLHPINPNRETIRHLLSTKPMSVSSELHKPSNLKALVCFLTEMQWRRKLLEELLMIGAMDALKECMMSRLNELLAVIERKCSLRTESAPAAHGVDPKERVLQQLLTLLSVAFPVIDIHSMPRYIGSFRPPNREANLGTILRVLRLRARSNEEGFYYCHRCQAPSIQTVVGKDGSPPQTQCDRCHWSLYLEAKNEKRLQHAICVMECVEAFNWSSMHLTNADRGVPLLRRCILGPAVDHTRPPNAFQSDRVIAALDSLSIGEREKALEFVMETIRLACTADATQNLFVGEGAAAFMKLCSQELLHSVMREAGIDTKTNLNKYLQEDPVQVHDQLYPSVKELINAELHVDIDAGVTYMLVQLGLRQLAQDEASSDALPGGVVDPHAVLVMALIRQCLSQARLLAYEQHLLAESRSRPEGPFTTEFLGHSIDRQRAMIADEIIQMPALVVAEEMNRVLRGAHAQPLQ